MKHSEIISKEEEQRLWERGVLGVSDPKALQNATFLQLGRRCAYEGV